MKTFRLTVGYQEYGSLEVEADSVEEAIEKTENEMYENGTENFAVMEKGDGDFNFWDTSGREYSADEE